MVIYNITGNIDCEGVSFQPIGGADNETFQGMINGNFFSLSNVNIVNDGQMVGIIAYGNNSFVNNLVLDNITVASNNAYQVGLLFGRCDNCQLDGITVKNSEIDVSMNKYSGGLISYSMNSIISNCNTINNQIKATSNATDDQYSGSLIGINFGGDISNCISSDNTINSRAGNITNKNTYTGGICAYNFGSNITSTSTHKNIIKSVSRESYSGGLVGYNNNTGKTDNCSSYNNVFTFQSQEVNTVGALYGFTTSLSIPKAIVSNCVSYNNNITTAYISASTGDLGGISGYSDRTIYSDCSSYNNTFLSGDYTAYIAGIVGDAGFGSIIISCDSNYNSISSIGASSSFLGGISGFTLFSSISNCFSFNNTLNANSSSYSMGGITAFGQNSSVSGCRSQNNSIFSFYNSSNGLCGGISGQLFQLGLIENSNSTNNNIFCKTSGGILGANFNSTILNCIYELNVFSSGNQNDDCCYVKSSGFVITNCTSLYTTTPPTFIPSTQIPSTLTPSTTIPSTLFPSTIIPTFPSLSTILPTDSSISTSTIPTATNVATETSVSTSISPSSTNNTQCFYNVPNCEKCDQSVSFGISTFNVSCTNLNGVWVWIFQSTNISTPNIVTINSTVYVIGNFTQDFNSTIQFIISGNKSSVLFINGCVSLKGNIEIILQEKPVQGNSTFQLITYNCTESLNISDSQFKIKPTYSKSECDKIEHQSNQQMNSLSVTFSTSLNKNCKKNIALIIGLCVGLPCLILILFVSGLLVLKLRNNYSVKKEVAQFNGNKMEGYVENKTFQEKTKWEEKDDL